MTILQSSIRITILQSSTVPMLRRIMKTSLQGDSSSRPVLSLVYFTYYLHSVFFLFAIAFLPVNATVFQAVTVDRRSDYRST